MDLQQLLCCCEETQSHDKHVYSWTLWSCQASSYGWKIPKYLKDKTLSKNWPANINGGKLYFIICQGWKTMYLVFLKTLKSGTTYLKHVNRNTWYNYQCSIQTNQSFKIANFLGKFEEILHTICFSNKKCLIIGDNNIHTLRPNILSKEYVNLLCMEGFNPFIHM